MKFKTKFQSIILLAPFAKSPPRVGVFNKVRGNDSSVEAFNFFKLWCIGDGTSE